MPQVSITVRDLTPKFLAFYRDATARPVTPDERFALRKREYDFAAVPPTPEGDRIARRLLDAGWPTYASLLGRIEGGAAGLQPAPLLLLQNVADTLRADRPVHVNLLVYVGANEGNAFTTAGADDVPTVAVPVEESPHSRAPVMAHEFTHAAQIAMGTNAGGWVLSIGETVLAEGLAMRVAQHLYPDRPATSFVEMASEPGWLARSDAKQRDMLRDVRQRLASRTSEDVMRFTMGVGPSGFDREAYHAGWVIVEYWLFHGMSYGDIARIPEADAPARVGAAIDAILAG